MNKDFLLLWQGQFVSRLGNQAYMIAMMLWLKHATGSATLMGTLMMLSMLPMVLLSPLGGTFADLHSRRKIIVVSDLVLGVLVILLAALMFSAPDATGAIVGALLIVGVVSGVTGAFFLPAITAAIPSIVPQDKVAAANSLNESTYHAATLIGQAIGGVLVRVLGAPVLFLVDGISYVYSAVSEMFISIPQTIPEKRSTWRDELRRFADDTVEGLRHAWSRTGLRALLVASAFMNFFAMPYLVLFPFYVEDVLGRTPDWYGYLLAAYGAGSLVGYALYGSLRLKGAARGRVLIVCLMALSLSLGALGLSSHSWLSLTLILFAGITSGMFNVAAITLIQLDTRDEMRGRMFGLLHTLVGGLTPISMGLTGVVTDLLDQNVRLIYVSCGVALIAISVTLSLNQGFRTFLSADARGKSS
jgi:DHA3 family macrolide efflux protein-like MFS transporter